MAKQIDEDKFDFLIVAEGNQITDDRTLPGQRIGYSSIKETIEFLSWKRYPNPWNSVIDKLEAAFFKVVNDQGGVSGLEINFITLDDGYSPPKTVEQVRMLIEEDHFSGKGSATACAVALPRRAPLSVTA